MRLTLIYPSVGRKENKPYVRAWQMQPLSMAVLASITPPDIDVRFYDDRMEEIPFDEPTDLVAISVETFTALRAYRIARQFRCRGVPVVMGGYHVTLLPEEARQEADAIVVGDAEPIWRNCSTRLGTVACRANIMAWGGENFAESGRGARFSPVGGIKTSRWSNSPAAAISNAIFARSRPFMAPIRIIDLRAKSWPRWKASTADGSSSSTTIS